MLRLNSIVKTYRRDVADAAVLRGVSFSAEHGSFIAIRGRSGSGKSTLMNVIAGLDRPDSGELTLDGIDLTARSAEELARLRLERIGIVFQFFNLLPTLTLAQNIALPGHLLGLPAAEIERRTEEGVRSVGLEGAADRRPHQASGGEIQRAAVARALFNRPRLVLADEPTGNLDEENALQVFALCIDLIRQRNSTLLLVTHDASLAARADHRFLLQDGVLQAIDLAAGSGDPA